MKIKFAQRRSVEQVEESAVLAPKFDGQGLIPVITTDVESGEVLMQGYMNAEALCQTITTGEAHYYSRSRQVLWHKGATSGLVQQVAQLLIDDDQDCLWMRVRMAGAGASCHVGYRSCFYREIPLGDTVGVTELAAGDPADAGAIALRFTESAKTFDPQIVYGDVANPTRL